jgi:hypothetical protein
MLSATVAFQCLQLVAWRGKQIIEAGRRIHHVTVKGMSFVVFGALRGRMETATNLVEVLAEHSGSIRMLD